MAPRGSSVGASSPMRASSHPTVARRLDFEQEESSVQETPALSGSGQRRGKRADVYDIPEDGDEGLPVPETSAALEESYVQEEITANDDSVIFNEIVEASFSAQLGDETTIGAEAIEDLVDAEESVMTPELVKQPAKRGRKRKSDDLEPPPEEHASLTKSRKGGLTSSQAQAVQKKSKQSLAVPPAASRRSKRVSDMTEQEPSVMDVSVDVSTNTNHDNEENVAPVKRRGRPPRAKQDAEKENAVSEKPAKGTAAKGKVDSAFKKPSKPIAKPKDKSTTQSKAESKLTDKASETTGGDSGKLVDVHGHPLSKKDIEQMSTTSVGSRYGRGRHLSVFRELEPEAVARVGRTGRHRVAPIDFWKNDRIAYDPDGSMTSIVKNQDPEPERKVAKAYSSKLKKRKLTAIEEEELELEPWEAEDGFLVGNYRDYDPVADVTTSDIVEDSE